MDKILQLRIELNRVKFPIWRRLLVQATDTLGKLHQVIQIAMGWEDSHLHEFKVGLQEYSDLSFELDEAEDEEELQLSDITLKKIGYLYDFGDSWEHTIRFEKELEAKKGEAYPQCIGGERACPLEDCGSIPGHEEVLEAKENPEEADKDLIVWMGNYDPEFFDLESINKKLASLQVITT